MTRQTDNQADGKDEHDGVVADEEQKLLQTTQLDLEPVGRLTCEVIQHS